MSHKYYFKFIFVVANFYFYFSCALVLCLHVCLRKGVRYAGTGVIDSCELPCGCWELNPGPLEEQSLLLTTESSL